MWLKWLLWETFTSTDDIESTNILIHKYGSCYPEVQWWKRVFKESTLIWWLSGVKWSKHKKTTTSKHNSCHSLSWWTSGYFGYNLLRCQLSPKFPSIPTATLPNATSKIASADDCYSRRFTPYLQLNLTTQQPARRPRRVEKVVGMCPSGTTTWLTGGWRQTHTCIKVKLKRHKWAVWHMHG